MDLTLALEGPDATREEDKSKEKAGDGDVEIAA